MNRGIAGLLENPISLEERIEKHLSRAATHEELQDTYVDAADRIRVRRRGLIEALLNAVFEHEAQNVDPKGIEVAKDAPPSVWSELADARRDYLHDVELLNSGKNGELVLKPTKMDEALTDVPIKAKVKELITWLAVIHLWQENISQNFPTQASVIDKAARSMERKAGSIKTELSYYTKQERPSDKQIAYFWQLIDLAQRLARTAGSESDAFKLLLPAALTLSGAAIREPRSTS